MKRLIGLFTPLFLMTAGLVVAVPSAQPAAADGLPTLRVGDVTVIEGDSGMAIVKVPVDLSAPTAARVVVTYDITSTTATPGVEFQQKHARLVFASFATTKVIPVRVWGDTDPEADETISVTLSNPQFAGIEDGEGVITMVDDDHDGATGLQASIGDVRVQEADGGVHYAYVPITLSQPAPAGGVKVHYSLVCGMAGDGSNFVIKQQGYVTFLRGVREKDVKFTIPANQTPEEAMTFLQTLTVTSGPATVHVSDGGGTIVDDDVPPPPPGGGSSPSVLGVGEVARVSVASDGSEAQFTPPGICTAAGGGGSGAAAISEDGRYVAYVSNALNLVPNDTSRRDVYEYDRLTGTTERVSVTSDGSESAVANASTTLGAMSPAISADGRYVTFSSNNPLVPGIPTIINGIYIHDRVTGETELVSKKMDGTAVDANFDSAPVSADGRYVAFVTSDSGLVPNDTDPVDPQQDYGDVYVHDRLTDTNTLVTTSYDGSPASGAFVAMTPDARYVTFTSYLDNVVPGDTNGCGDVFRRDMSTGDVQRVNVTSAGEQTQRSGDGECPFLTRWAPMSDDGSKVAFDSSAWNLDPTMSGPAPDAGHSNWRTYVHDFTTNTTQAVSDPSFTAPGQWSQYPSISGDGNVVEYEGNFGNPSVGEVHVYNLTTGTDTLAGELPDGTIADEPVYASHGFGATQALSYDGSSVVFSTSAGNLIPDDLNDSSDVYVQRLS